MARRRGVSPGTHEPKTVVVFPPVVSGGIGEALRLIDAMMPVMEAELRSRWPFKDDEPHDIGVILFPTVPVRTSADMYRAHVREMLARIDDDRDFIDAPVTERPTINTQTLRRLATLTKAELLGITSMASLKHPLRHSDAVLMEVLLREVLPDVAARSLGEPEVHNENIMAEVRRDIAERLVVSPERRNLA